MKVLWFVNRGNQSNHISDISDLACLKVGLTARAASRTMTGLGLEVLSHLISWWCFWSERKTRTFYGAGFWTVVIQDHIRQRIIISATPPWWRQLLAIQSTSFHSPIKLNSFPRQEEGNLWNCPSQNRAMVWKVLVTSPKSCGCLVQKYLRAQSSKSWVYHSFLLSGPWLTFPQSPL